MSVISFFVSSGSTQSGACITSASFYVYADDSFSPNQCDGCTAAGYTCWPCLSTSQQVFSDSGLTQTIGDGYYSNNIELNSATIPLYNTWYVVGGFPQGAGYTSCSGLWPYVMNSVVSSLNCDTPSNQSITAYTQQVQYNQGPIYDIDLIDPTTDTELNACIETVRPYSGMTQRWDLIINPLTELCYVTIDVTPITWNRIDAIVGTEVSNQWDATFNYYLDNVLVYSYTGTSITTQIQSPTSYGCYQTILWYGLIGNGPTFPVRVKDLPTPTPTPTNTSTPTNTPSVTPTNTPSTTPTNTQTPTNTATRTQTPTVTPTNTQTPTGTPPSTPTNTPTPSATPKEVNFKTIAVDFETLANLHKQLNSFGLGDIDQLSYLTQSRLKEENTTFNSPYYPLLYIVPSKVEHNPQYKLWEFNTTVSDIVETTLQNNEDTLSDTLQILNDVVSQFRLSVIERFGDYIDKYYVDDEVLYTPYMGEQDDNLNGWNGVLKIKTMTSLDRCAAAFNTWTGTTIQHPDGINFKTFTDDFRMLSEYHKQIQSFGFGKLDEFTYWNEMRLKEDNEHYNSPYYPYLFVMPGEVTNKFGFMEYKFKLIVADIIQRDLANQIDVLSDTNQIMDDIIGQFRLSVTQSLGNFNELYYLDDTVICNPFLEKYDDLLGGWTADLTIQVMSPLDRCDAAFNSWLTPTPTVTPTITPTASVTPTNTSTPTNTPTTTETSTPTQTPTNTLTPTNTETPTQTPSETPTSTPSETPTNTPTNTNTGTPTNTPTNTSTPTPSITASATMTQTPTNTSTPTNTPSATPTNTPTPSGGAGAVLWNNASNNWNDESRLWNTI